MKFLLLAVLAIGLFSCKSVPQGKVVDTVKEPAGWEKGVQQYQDFYVIETTWVQGFHYAFKTGYTLYLCIGVALLTLAGYALYRKAIDKGIGEKKRDSGIVFYLVLFALLVGGVAFIHAKPASIAGQRYKVKAESYWYHLNKDGNINACFDSIYNANHLIGAAK